MSLKISTAFHAILNQANQFLLLGTLTTATTYFIFSGPAQALPPKALDQIAESITVRIEGATQGSGVLLQKNNNRYSVLTAWHVIGDQREGEELAIRTPDNKIHDAILASAKKIDGQIWRLSNLNRIINIKSQKSMKTTNLNG